MNENTLEIFKEKAQPTLELIREMKTALAMHPAVYEAERMSKLKAARDSAQANAQIIAVHRHPEAAERAAKAIRILEAQINEIEKSGPYTSTDAALFAEQLQLKIQEAERWAYIVMLYDLLDSFTTLTYWQDLQLEAINTGFEYFGRANYFPEHWKLSTHAQTEVKIMALVEEITKIVMEEGKSVNNEIND